MIKFYRFERTTVLDEIGCSTRSLKKKPRSIIRLYDTNKKLRIVLRVINVFGILTKEQYISHYAKTFQVHKRRMKVRGLVNMMNIGQKMFEISFLRNFHTWIYYYTMTFNTCLFLKIDVDKNTWICFMNQNTT